MSILRVDNFGPSAGGTTYSAGGIAKAWVNFNGTGTVAIRDSLNGSSLVDNGTGYQDVNLISAMNTSQDYSTIACCSFDGDAGQTNKTGIVEVLPLTSSKYSQSVWNTANSYFDNLFNSSSVHGDLA